MRRLSPLLAVSPALLLAGCLGDVMEVFCETGPDSDHCYQAAAVQEAEPDGCAKGAGEGFSGSNPPKDKCFLQIAENTGGVRTDHRGQSPQHAVQAVRRGTARKVQLAPKA